MATYWVDFFESLGISDADTDRVTFATNYIDNFVQNGKCTLLVNTGKLQPESLHLDIDIIKKMNVSSVNTFTNRNDLATTRFLPQTQISTTTLTGTSGTANITVNGTAYLATFDTDLSTTAANFVTAHSTALLAAGITVTSGTGTIIFTGDNIGTSFTIGAAVNATGNLAGTTAATQIHKIKPYEFAITSLPITNDTTMAEVLSKYRSTIVDTIANKINADIKTLTDATKNPEFEYFNIVHSIGIVSDGFNTPYLSVITKCRVFDHAA